ncbi:tetratricopeptide repeat protein [Streptomyces sp. NPDC058739]|uniref:tetratricopeptide repeat protein n=1 Tax=Streptomyces sp. NPDC058739 TaxID=3346618 RepID=UPI0036CF34B2
MGGRAFPREAALDRARLLIAEGRSDEARRTVRTALTAAGPDPELFLVLALAHIAEDDDEHDDRAEEVYRDALDAFPDHLALLAQYAELCIGGDFNDRPARSNRGPALAARVAELAPDSPEARRLAELTTAPWRTKAAGRSRSPRRARAHLYDLQQALAGGGVHEAAERARAQAVQRPGDVRRAMLAEALEAPARPQRALLVPLVRKPYEAAFLRAVLLAVFLCAAVGLRLPQWLGWGGFIAQSALPYWLGSCCAAPGAGVSGPPSRTPSRQTRPRNRRCPTCRRYRRPRGVNWLSA